MGVNIGGIPYALPNREGGFLIEQKNFRELAKKIIVLLKSGNLKKELKKKERERNYRKRI